MQRVLERRQAERGALLARAAGCLPALRRATGPVTAVVYGSVARGDFNRWSDIDLLIVAADLPAQPLERLDLLLRVCPPGVEPRGYTVAEFARLQRRVDAQLGLLLRESVVLADDLGLLTGSSTHHEMAEAAAPGREPHDGR